MKLITLLTAAVSLTVTSMASAALLSVDFNYSPNVSTQLGFQSFAGIADTAGKTASQAFGPITVTLATTGALSSNLGFFNRATLTDSGAFTYANLYNDFAFVNSQGSIPTMQLSISGLTAAAQYSLTLYAYDAAGQAAGTTTNFAPTASTTGTSGSVTYSSAVLDRPTTNSQYSTTLLLSSTTTTLDVLLTPSNAINDQNIRLNGFQISAVPEPSTWAFFGVIGVAAGTVLLRERRRKAI